jgi:nitrous oxidase accessory protein NosD
MMRLAVIAGILWCFTPSSRGDTLLVPGSYPFIQEAIVQSSEGDTVLVSPGTYVENLDFLGKNITVMSSRGPSVTVIDGNGAGQVVCFRSGEGSSAILQGFTLRNGDGYITGGGLCCYFTSPTIKYNHIVTNSALTQGAGYGGGIWCFGGAPVIEGNTIAQNVAWNGGGICLIDASPRIASNMIRFNQAEEGGGIWCSEGASPLIENNTIAKNSPGGVFCNNGSEAVVKGNLVGENHGIGVVCYHKADAMILDNTIQGNVNPLDEFKGGGIHCSYCNPFIKGNFIHGNRAQGGGGIYCWYACPIVKANTISVNQAEMNGGGIFCSWESCPEISQNHITGNTAAKGGGILFHNHADALVDGNLLMENTADDGGGLHCWDASPQLTNNLLIRNQAKKGGAVFCLLGALPPVTNNTLYQNEAEIGGGFYNTFTAAPVLTNTILWANQAASHPAIYHDTGTLTISYCDVEGGWPGEGNIDADPLFVDPASLDLHLAYPSPCRDAGSNAAKALPEKDFRGDPRVVNGLVDMGVDEIHPHLYYTGTATPGGEVKIKLIGWPDALPAAVFGAADVLDPPLPSPWGEWHLAFPLLGSRALGAIPPQGYVMLDEPIPSRIQGPFSLPMQALTGDALTNLCVLEIK